MERPGPGSGAGPGPPAGGPGGAGRGAAAALRHAAECGRILPPPLHGGPPLHEGSAVRTPRREQGAGGRSVQGAGWGQVDTCDPTEANQGVFIAIMIKTSYS